MLLPSPTKATRTLASRPRCSKSVKQSESTWQGWCRSERPLMTGTRAPAARSTTLWWRKVRAITRSTQRSRFRAMALAEPDVAGPEVDGGAAQLHHADLVGDARAEARLLEDHGERPPCQQRVRRSVAQLVLQALGEGEDRLDLLGGEIGETQEVALHR